MTKAKPPLTIESALDDVLQAIDVKSAAKETRHTPGYLYSLTDVDSRFQLSVRDAITLDRAHDAATGGGFPIYRTMGLLLGIEPEPAETPIEAIARAFAATLHECGEAHQAVVHLMLDPSARSCTIAKREISEAIGALAQTLRLVVARAAARAPPDTT